MRASGSIFGGFLLAGCLAGCGGGESPPPMVPSMADLAEQEASAAVPNVDGASNRPPRVDFVRLDPSQPVPGEPLRAVVEATDPDGSPVRLSYRWTLDGEPLPYKAAEITLGQVAKGSSIEVQVIARDGEAESAPATARVRVRNRPPLVRSVSLQPSGAIHAGTGLLARVDAADPDGDPLQYEWVWLVNGREVARDEPVFSTAGLRRGDAVQVQVRVSDGEESSPRSASHEVELANAAPVISSQPQGVDETGLFEYAVQAEDPDGDSLLQYALTTAPEGMSIDAASGEVTWRPTPEQSGRHPVEVVVADRHGGTATQRFDLVVGTRAKTAPEAPAAPAD